MKTTILGGVLFLVPVVVLLLILGKAYELSMMVAGPVDQLIPVERLGGVALVNLLAILLLLVICYAAGLIATKSFIAPRIEALEGILIDIMPGYVAIKSTIGSVAQRDEEDAILQPVLVRFDDYEQIAFEVEGDETRAVVFLPGAPSAWAGTSVIVERARITPVTLPTYQSVKLMRTLGRGSLSVHGDAMTGRLPGAAAEGSQTGSTDTERAVPGA